MIWVNKLILTKSDFPFLTISCDHHQTNRFNVSDPKDNFSSYFFFTWSRLLKPIIHQKMMFCIRKACYTWIHTVLKWNENPYVPWLRVSLCFFTNIIIVTLDMVTYSDIFRHIKNKQISIFPASLAFEDRLFIQIPFTPFSIYSTDFNCTN